MTGGWPGSMLHSMEPKQFGPDDLPGGESGPHTGGWVFPVFLAAIVLAVAVVAQTWRLGHHSAPSENLSLPWIPSPKAEGETVALEVDFGNGAKKQLEALAWKPGMTVGDLMDSAQSFRPGITFQQIGEGESGFLTTLDGLANEGLGGRNWHYKVDGKHSEVSFCLQPIEAGSRVLWTFAEKD